MDKNNDVINEKEEVPVTYFDTLKSKEVEWLWKPYIAFGKLTVLEGDPGDGKTTLEWRLLRKETLKNQKRLFQLKENLLQ